MIESSHFSVQQLIEHYEEGLDISRDETITEWTSLRSEMVKNPEKYGKLAETLKIVANSEVYPNLAKIAMAALVIPASTAG
jgi:hypothetical protein